jgi:hypothetical protein
MKDLWYKRAIIYCLDVGTFMDTNGDGVGDFAGVTKRLDYLAGLGVTCLLPAGCRRMSCRPRRLTWKGCHEPRAGNSRIKTGGRGASR